MRWPLTILTRLIRQSQPPMPPLRSVYTVPSTHHTVTMSGLCTCNIAGHGNATTAVYCYPFRRLRIARNNLALLTFHSLSEAIGLSVLGGRRRPLFLTAAPLTQKPTVAPCHFTPLPVIPCKLIPTE
jgi:hypothetical protein